MAMTSTQQQFVDRLMPAAVDASERTGVDPRIIIAQAAQETGWGRSAPNNNYFGIKSHGESGGGNFQTREFVNGQWVTVNDSFRGYESPEDSVRGYADFILANPRYTDFRSAGDLQSQLDALQASGYATDPGYSRSVGSIAQGIPLPNGAPPRPAPSPQPNALSAANQMAGVTPTAPPPNALSAYFGVNPTRNFLADFGQAAPAQPQGNNLNIDARTRSLMGGAADASRGRALASLPVLQTRDDGSVFARQGRTEIEMGSTRRDDRKERNASSSSGAVRFVAKGSGKELKPKQAIRTDPKTGKRTVRTIYAPG